MLDIYLAVLNRYCCRVCMMYTHLFKWECTQIQKSC